MTKKIVLGRRSDADLTGPELMKIGQDSVVRISSKVGGASFTHGSAFVYKQVVNEPKSGMSRLHLVTNLHNVKGALSIFPSVVRGAQSGQTAKQLDIQMVVEFRGVEYEISKAIVAKGKLFAENQFFDDFAFVSVEVPTTDELSLFAIPEDGDVLQGDAVFALGFPADTNLGISEGIISHLYDENPPIPEYKWQIQHSILINPGNSGGPTVSRKGVAVGMSTWKWRHLDGINFSVNLHHLFRRVKDLSELDEVDLKGVFSKMTARALEEARFGN